MSEFSASGFKEHAISDDGSKLILTFTTRFVGDFRLTIPIDCASELVAALNQVRSLVPAPAAAPPQNPASPAPPAATVQPAAAARQSARISVPKQWAVAKDVKVPGGAVILVFDPRADTQSSYALHPGPAKELAAALTKQADSLLSRGPNGVG